MEISYAKCKLTGRVNNVRLVAENFEDQRIVSMLVEGIERGKIAVTTKRRKMVFRFPGLIDENKRRKEI